jgi:hypothetical protein
MSDIEASSPIKASESHSQSDGVSTSTRWPELSGTAICLLVFLPAGGRLSDKLRFNFVLFENAVKFDGYEWVG